MDFVVDFDAKNNILRWTLEDEVTDAVLLDFYAVATKYAASHPPCRSIIDFSKVTDFHVSSETVRQVAAAPTALPAQYLRVIVIPSDFIYGMGRMFQILSEKTRPELHVVRTMDEAYRLLHVESPEFGSLT